MERIVYAVDVNEDEDEKSRMEILKKVTKGKMSVGIK